MSVPRKLRLVASLNEYFACTRCGQSGRWVDARVVTITENSSIVALRCANCADTVIAKVIQAAPSDTKLRCFARQEHQVLVTLQHTFHQDDEYGTLIPLGYVELDDSVVIITRRFDGRDLSRSIKLAPRAALPSMMFRAGMLLRRLHDACPAGYETRRLEVSDKEEYLDQRYGEMLRSAHGLDAVWNRFLDFGAELGTTEIRSTWSHSDFKPSNVLCNKTKYIVLDTRLNINAPVVYDIACFLAHIWIQLRKHQVRTDYSFWGQLEQSFLRGYAGLTEREMQALQWAQLYYMLHYLGRYQEHSGIRAIYGRWNTLPVLHRLAAKLQSAGDDWKNNENVS